MYNFLIGAKMDSTTIIMLVLLAIMVVVLIVLPMFTNKRRNKAINDLHSSLRPGDIIKTVGGIVGTIKEIKDISPVDKEMVVETGVGDNKSTMVFDVQAVYQVLSKADAPVAPAEPFNETATEEKAEEVNEEVKEAATEEPVKEPVTEEAAPAVEEEQKTEKAAEEDKPATASKPRSKSAKK